MLGKTYTIGLKIVTIVILAMISVFAVSAIAFIAFDSLNDEYEEMKNRHIVGKMATLSINRDINYISRLTRNIMLGSDLSKDGKKLYERIDAIKAQFKRLHIATEGSEEVVWVKKAQSAALGFIEDGYNFVLALEDIPANERYKEYVNYEKTATPLANESRKFIEKLIERIDKDFETSLQHFQSEIHKAKIITVIAFVVIGIMLTLSSMMIMGSINRPIKKIISSLEESSLSINTIAKEVAQSSHTLAEGSQQQAATVEESVHSLHGMSGMTQYTAQNAADTDIHAKEAKSVAERANLSIVALTEAIREIAVASRQTQKIIKSIDEIALKTNLLAINAAVEAAHAGEESSGFGVIAKEVRTLALRAAEAAKVTEAIVQETVQKAQQGVELASRTEEEFDEVRKHASQVEELVGEIAMAAQKQATGIDAVVEGISHMEMVIQQNSVSATDSLSISDDLFAAAESLHDYVESLMQLAGNVQKEKRT